MNSRRWPWWVAAGCLSAAGAAAGVATSLHWRPCKESFLVGTVLEPFGARTDFSAECLLRMDGGTLFPVPDVAERAPELAVLGATAMALAGLAWLVVVLTMRWSRRTTVVAVLPALLTLVLAGAAALGIGAARSSGEAASLWLSSAVDVSAALAVWAVWSWETTVRGLGWVRLLLVLWGATSFGFVHLAVDFTIMAGWNSSNWDVPPGTGWLTVTGLIAAAVATAILAVRSGPDGSGVAVLRNQASTSAQPSGPDLAHRA